MPRLLALPGITLLTAGGRPVLSVVPHKGGAVVACGLSDLSTLRTPATNASVNRLLAESLALGLRPLTEPGTAGGAFPAQPVLGRGTFAIGDALPGKGLGAAETASPDGAKAFRVIDSQTISLSVGGTPIERTVRHLLTRQDFQLAPHAAPLEKLAKETGGRHRDLLSMTDVLPPGLQGTPRSSATRLPLWPGPWSLAVILVLVSAEYLLRRRAGKVM